MITASNSLLLQIRIGLYAGIVATLLTSCASKPQIVAVTAPEVAALHTITAADADQDAAYLRRDPSGYFAHVSPDFQYTDFAFSQNGQTLDLKSRRKDVEGMFALPETYQQFRSTIIGFHMNGNSADVVRNIEYDYSVPDNLNGGVTYCKAIYQSTDTWSQTANDWQETTEVRRRVSQSAIWDKH